MSDLLKRFTDHVAILFKQEDPKSMFYHAALGICGEAGELADAVKKHVAYGKALDTDNVLEESGDLLFYAVQLLTMSGHTLEEAMEHNIKKLKDRYPQGYSDQAALARADKLIGVLPTPQAPDTCAPEVGNYYVTRDGKYFVGPIEEEPDESQRWSPAHCFRANAYQEDGTGTHMSFTKMGHWFTDYDIDNWDIVREATPEEIEAKKVLAS